MVLFIRLNSSLCGCSLRTGTLILLYLSLLGSIIWLIYFIRESKESDTSVTNETKNEPRTRAPIPRKGALDFIRVMLIFTINVMGLVGVYTEQSGYLIGYLVFNFVDLCFQLMFSIILILQGEPFVLDGIVALTIVLIIYYLWLIVYSHYCELSERETPMPPIPINVP